MSGQVEITCSALAVLAPVAAGAPRERKVKDFDEDLPSRGGQAG